jgi:uncharacterized phage infection (PIP) family protein YhgE
VRAPGRLALLAAATLIFVADGALLASGTAKEVRQKKRQAAAVEKRLIGRIASLRSLQDQSNSQRSRLESAFNAVDELHNLAGVAEGIPQADVRFPAARDSMDRAKTASDGLPQLTGKIVHEVEAAKADIAALESLVTDAARLDYLKALDRALGLLIQTHNIYGRANTAIAGGMKLYSDLFAATGAFLQRERSGGYRSRREAAASYTVATEGTVASIQTFSAQLDAISKEADASAKKTTEALRRAAMLYSKLRT